jgi:hypothetical protein
MPALVLAAALMLASPPPAAPCRIGVHQAGAPVGLAPHPLGQEPSARRMHAVLRKVDGCVIVDVSVVRSGALVWEYQPAGPAIARPAEASAPR